MPRGVWRPLWELYVRVGLPAAGAVVSPGWREVGSFLGPSIRDFYERLAARRQLLRLWRDAGIDDAARPAAQPRRRSRRLGNARVTATPGPPSTRCARAAGATT